MTERRQWLQTAVSFLQGAMGSLNSIEDCITIPRKQNSILYPHDPTAPDEVKAERFESFVRTFMLASVLIHEDPGLTINGISIKEYYQKWLLLLCSGEDRFNEYRIGLYQEHSSKIQQETVECGLLTVALWLCEEEIWNTISEDERSEIISFISSYAYGKTVPQNWRICNMLMLAFLYRNGHQIDETLMRDYALGILRDHAGDGWFRDGKGFDYYTAWSYHTLLPIWCIWYGYDKEPSLAGSIEQLSNRFLATYIYVFDRHGRVPIWGRSSIYRIAAAAPFWGNLLLRNSTMNPGLARTIMTGQLCSFLFPGDVNMGSSTDLFQTSLGRNLPSVADPWESGYFPPMIQPYSCAASPYWMSMIFWCLHFPETHPFWTANNPVWKEENKELTLNGPGLAISVTDRGCGIWIRPGKVYLPEADNDYLYCYTRLAYHSGLPWGTGFSGSHQDRKLFIEPMQYSITENLNDGIRNGWKRHFRSLVRRLKTGSKDSGTGSIHRVTTMLWGGIPDRVLYRRAFFDKDLSSAWEWAMNIRLADVRMPEGILRADLVHCAREGCTITLGSFSFPVGTEQLIYDQEREGRAYILKGEDSSGHGMQMAVTFFGQWDKCDIIKSGKTTPDLIPVSTVYGAVSLQSPRDRLLVSQVLVRENAIPFSRDELFPVCQIREGTVIELSLADGDRIMIDHGYSSSHLEL